MVTIHKDRHTDIWDAGGGNYRLLVIGSTRTLLTKAKKINSITHTYRCTRDFRLKNEFQFQYPRELHTKVMEIITG